MSVAFTPSPFPLRLVSWIAETWLVRRASHRAALHASAELMDISYREAKWLAVQDALGRARPVPGRWDDGAVRRRILTRTIGVAEARLVTEVSLDAVPAWILAAEPAPTAEDVAAAERARDRAARAAGERWRSLLLGSRSHPTQRAILERWHATPDARLADVARALGLTPAAAEQAVRRLRRRA